MVVGNWSLVIGCWLFVVAPLLPCSSALSALFSLLPTPSCIPLCRRSFFDERITSLVILCK
ncbi:hypothetical protein C7Y66_08335 [Chroococcidiopsis sp. CCALA 051]|nr:hypothetical protein C7Y66_08335 [Chroococcidiopsis sp. CCALA 051]